MGLMLEALIETTEKSQSHGPWDDVFPEFSANSEDVAEVLASLIQAGMKQQPELLPLFLSANATMTHILSVALLTGITYERKIRDEVPSHPPG